MNQPPVLFDDALRVLRRDRAAAHFHKARYLHEEAASGLAQRLSMVKRAFPKAAIFGAADGVYAQAMQGRMGIEELRQFESSKLLARRARDVAAAEIADISSCALAPQSCDLIVFGLELHAVNDPIGAMAQARAALKPDGLFIGCGFAGNTLKELRAAFGAAEAQIEGGLSPRVFPMAELRALGSLLQRAGFALPAADSDKFEVWHETPLALMQELRAMGETNTLLERRRGFLRRATLMRALEIYTQENARADGKTRASFEIAYLLGWAPAASQPKPLRPGSAKARLADALGATERSAGEKPDGRS